MVWGGGRKTKGNTKISHFDVNLRRQRGRGGAFNQPCVYDWVYFLLHTHFYYPTYNIPLVCGSTPHNLTPQGLIMQRVRTAWGVIGTADVCLLMGYFQLFSVRFQVRCLALTNFALQYPVLYTHISPASPCSYMAVLCSAFTMQWWNWTSRSSG